MPTVSVIRDQLYKELGKEYSDEEFDELCFQFGIEVDDIVNEPEKGIVLKIEVGANRFDLLCLEGIAQALNVFLGNAVVPTYQIVPHLDANAHEIYVTYNTAEVRPYVVGAVLRHITFSEAVYNSFIDLQEKLHQNICRKRKLASVGTHDLDTIEGPFLYDAREPKSVSFIPLNRSEAVTSDVLLEQLAHDSHLKEYVPLIQHSPKHPVIYDKNGVILSLPPIINGDHSKITLKTRNVFIECTATDLFKAQIVLDTLVCMFSKYCKQPFTVEPVKVTYHNGDTYHYPVLEYRDLDVDIEYCNSLVGIQESQANIADYLRKMSLDAKPSKNPKTVTVRIPPTRYDILHPCDIAEDLAVAYGYDRLAQDMHLAPTMSIGQEFELNYLSDKIRLLLSQNNYTEAATFTLCSKADLGQRMRVDLENEPYVEVANPKTVECEALRTTLIPGLLKTLAANRHIALPIRLFEVADVVIKDPDPNRTLGIGARNERHMCALHYGMKAGLEIVQSVLDSVMLALKISFCADDTAQGYYLLPTDHPSFFPGWCASVHIHGEQVGLLGMVHPEVITNFNLNHPLSVLTLNIQRSFDLSDI